MQSVRACYIILMWFCCGCLQGLNGITHTDSNDKTMVNVTWTAPPACTGPVTFRFAAVEVRNMYWANVMGPQLNGKYSHIC